jgi:hypothetical protein
METTWARFERFATALTKELGSVWRDGAWTSPATRKPRVGVTDVHLHVRMDHETSEAYFALYDGHHDEQPWDCFCSLPDEACVRTHDARFGQMLQTMSVCVRAQGRTALVVTLECRPQLHDVAQRIDWLQLRWTLRSTAPGACVRVHADEVARVSHAVRKRIRRLRTELRRAPLSLSLGRVDVLVPWKKRRIVCV